ncbi:hypothetical protein RO955_10975 [Staphylococcus haemolyticus]|uniref:hypothetical protein n=1 Tax=Staphylococcus haemolyticus TaxID=1283 RepID=UPI00187A61A3|nr:hypothetical protein [Staphylococcus haemolyticus]MBE7335464.1 hypothetical protein [Staphylococcus haemolyticus]MBE7345106.1 hypothetical protein [Staphylococcus haemolyticus]MCC3662568.1 hypothetical protein [Staphylococcus haemolyticus]MCC3715657.1 hypothetical protein [Staphylococcus haemolyticus]MCH4325900.1 hypothetical protein [Staphylococcus haemolyticus]
MKTIETMQSYHLLKLLFSNSEVSYVLEEWNQQYEAVEIKTRNGHFKRALCQIGLMSPNIEIKQP